MFFLLLIALAYAENALTLHIIRSPHGLDWSSPKTLTRTVTRNALSGGNRIIGHVAVELRCEATETQEAVYELTGMTNQDPKVYRKLLLAEKAGLALMFKRFPGRLKRKDELEVDLAHHYNQPTSKNRITFIKHLVSRQTCQRLQQYLEQFRQQGHHKYYGLPLNPRAGEGAGCSAFGVSFLINGGLMTDDYRRDWSYRIRAPKELIGRDQSPTQAKQKVRFLKLYFLSHKHNQWAKPNEPHQEVFFWDPDTMYNSIVNQLKHAKKHLVRGKNKGIIVDARSTPTPQMPLFTRPKP